MFGFSSLDVTASSQAEKEIKNLNKDRDHALKRRVPNGGRIRQRVKLKKARRSVLYCDNQAVGTFKEEQSKG